MAIDSESMALVKRALKHLKTKGTDQAGDTLSQPIASYIDPDQYKREVDRLFKHLPLALALSLELPEPKSYRAMTVMEVPLILVRGAAGIAGPSCASKAPGRPSDLSAPTTHGNTTFKAS